MERCRALASRGAEVEAQLEEKNRLIERIEKRFGHAPSAAAEIAKLQKYKVRLMRFQSTRIELQIHSNVCSFSSQSLIILLSARVRVAVVARTCVRVGGVGAGGGGAAAAARPPSRGRRSAIARRRARAARHSARQQSSDQSGESWPREHIGHERFYGSPICCIVINVINNTFVGSGVQLRWIASQARTLGFVVESSTWR